MYHRAGEEWIESGVDRYVELRQSREVSDDVDFGHFDFVRDFVAHRVLRQKILLLRHIERWQPISAAAALRMLEDEPLAIPALRDRRRRNRLLLCDRHRISLEIAPLSTATK